LFDHFHNSLLRKLDSQPAGVGHNFPSASSHPITMKENNMPCQCQRSVKEHYIRGFPRTAIPIVFIPKPGSPSCALLQLPCNFARCRSFYLSSCTMMKKPRKYDSFAHFPRPLSMQSGWVSYQWVVEPKCHPADLLALGNQQGVPQI
jgi:hypothetical protein